MNEESPLGGCDYTQEVAGLIKNEFGENYLVLVFTNTIENPYADRFYVMLFNLHTSEILRATHGEIPFLRKPVLHVQDANKNESIVRVAKLSKCEEQLRYLFAVGYGIKEGRIHVEAISYTNSQCWSAPPSTIIAEYRHALDI